MTGQVEPISAKEASLPPAAVTSATASLFRSAQKTSTPARRRFFAIGLPMIPRPINPAFIVSVFPPLYKDARTDAACAALPGIPVNGAYGRIKKEETF